MAGAMMYRPGARIYCCVCSSTITYPGRVPIFYCIDNHTLTKIISTIEKHSKIHTFEYLEAVIHKTLQFNTEAVSDDIWFDNKKNLIPDNKSPNKCQNDT